MVLHKVSSWLNDAKKIMMIIKVFSWIFQLNLINRLLFLCWWVVILFCGFVELFLWPASDLSGDYGVRLGPINDWNEQPAKYYRQKNAEINNGRAAMMGILGVFAQEIATGQNLADQAATGHFSPFGVSINLSPHILHCIILVFEKLTFFFILLW